MVAHDEQNFSTTKTNPHPTTSPTTVMMSPINEGLITWGGITQAFSAFRRPTLSLKCRTPKTYITLHCEAARANCSSAAQTQSPAATPPTRHLNPHTQHPLRAAAGPAGCHVLHPVLTWQPSSESNSSQSLAKRPRRCVTKALCPDTKAVCQPPSVTVRGVQWS